MANAGDELADAVEDRLAPPLRPRAELAEHRPDELAVMPLLRLDRADPRALRGVAHAVPVPTIGVARGELAGVGALELADQEVSASAHGIAKIRIANSE